MRARREIAFIDQTVFDLASLVSGLRREVEAVVLDGARPVSVQMAEALAGRRGLAAIHVIAHGAPGEIRFEAGTLSGENLHAHAADLALLGAALEEDGELLLWSCNSGQGPRGRAFIEELAGVVGAHVRAADGLIGSPHLGGSWRLESGSTAMHRAPLSAAAIATYAGVMDMGTTWIVDVAGSGDFTSIQAAIVAAAEGDTITVGPGTYTENITINKSGLTIVSTGGADNTTILGQGSSALGAIVFSPGVSNVTFGGVGHGFTVVGIDNASPAIESAAIYLQGAHDHVAILGNEVVANGDSGLTSEYGYAITNTTISDNTFSGYTFAGAEPADYGFGNQFTTENVPRQLVVMGANDATVGDATPGVTFINNEITGTAGGINAAGQQQGNTLVTIDVPNSTITDNDFSGFTNRYASQLRAREENTTIENNTFSNDSGGNLGTSVEATGSETYGALGGNTIMVGPGQSINAAIAGAVAGDTIVIATGTYTENIVINKAGLTLKSASGVASDVVIQGTFRSGNSIPDGTTVGDWLETATAYTGASGAGITVSANDVTIKNLTVTSFTTGVELGSNNGLTLDGVALDECVSGVRKGTAAVVTDFTMSGGSITDSYHGMAIYAATTTGSFDHVTIDGTSFAHLTEKGIYAEQLSNALITNITMDDVGEFGRGPAFGAPGKGEYGNGIDVNLKHGTYDNIEISNFTFTDVGSSSAPDTIPLDYGAAISIKARDDGSYASPSASASNVTIHDGTIDGTSTGIRIGEPGKTNAGPAVTVNDVAISGADVAPYDNATQSVLTVTNADDSVTIVGGAGNDTLTGTAHDDTLTGNGGSDTAVLSGNYADATISIADGHVMVTTATGGTDTLTGVEKLQFVDKVVWLVDPAGVNGATGLASVVASATANDVILLLDGIHNLGTSTLNIDKTLTIIGQSETDTIINASGIDGYGMFVTADGTSLSNFTLDGPAAGGVGGNYGIKVQPDTGNPNDRVDGLDIDHVTVQNSGRSEFDLNGVMNATLSNVTADGNGTGGVGVALTDTLNVTLENVTTTGNAWGSIGLYPTNTYYDQPMSGVTITGTYTHDESIVIYIDDISAANDLTDLMLPASYGGAGWQVTNDAYRGAESTHFTLIYATEAEATAMALDMQSSPYAANERSVITDPDGNIIVKDGMSLQAAIDAAQDGDTILVYPGDYTESANYNPTTGANDPAFANPLGLLINKSVTIQGVDANGVPITDAEDVAATITASVQSNWGTSFFVTASDVTITGLNFVAAASGGEVNKAIEVIEDNFTLAYSVVGSAGGDVASTIYVNDDKATSDPDFVSDIASFNIHDNILRGDFVLTNGPGMNRGPTSFVLADNEFVRNEGSTDDYNWGVIITGRDDAVAWRPASLGGPLVATGNSFSADYTTDRLLFVRDDDSAKLPSASFIEEFIANNHIETYAYATNSAGEPSVVNLGTTYGFVLALTAAAASNYANPGDTLIIKTDGAPVDLSGSSSDQNLDFQDSSDVTVTTGTGADDITTGSGSDVVSSGSGDDTIHSGDGNDIVDAGDGNDTIVGGQGGGDDLYNGGSGTDLLTYPSATHSVTIDLREQDRSANPTVASVLDAASLPTNTPVGLATGTDIGTDVLISIEDATGGSGDDTFIGNAGANVFDGAGGSDTVDYSAIASGTGLNVVIDSINGAGYSALTTAGGSDTLIRIENIVGTQRQDLITGDGAANVLQGNGGNDALDGGGGNDEARFLGTATNKMANTLDSETIQLNATGLAVNQGTDILSNFETIRFSGSDSVFGNADDQVFQLNGANGNVITHAVNDAGVATEKGGTLNGSGGQNATGNVLDNDIDLDDVHSALTVTAISDGHMVGTEFATTYGFLTLNANGSYTYRINESNLTVEELNAGSAPLTETFTYTVFDGQDTTTATLTINVNGANDAPVAFDPSFVSAPIAEDGPAFTGNLGTTLALSTFANDDDNTLDTASFSFVGATMDGNSLGNAAAAGISYNPATGDFTFDPTGVAAYQAIAEGVSKDVVVTFQVTDENGLTDTGTVTFRVTGSNDGPTFGFAQGFESDSAGVFSGGDYGTVTVVENGSLAANGITTPDGTHFALLSETDSGPYTRFDGYRATFSDGLSAGVKVYLDTDWAAGSGFDYSVAASGSDGAHQRDFIFHVAKDIDTGQLLIAASNNSNGAVRQDLETVPGHEEIASSGWYTFQHTFHEVAGKLAVDLEVIDASGTVVFSQTLTNVADTIPAEVGGNRYGWFTDITVSGGLAVDTLGLGIEQGAVKEIADGASGEGSAAHTITEVIPFADVDLTDTHTVGVVENGSGYLGTLVAVVENDATGDGVGMVRWTYTVNDAAVEHLAAGEPLTQTYTLTLGDGNSGSAAQTVTVTLTGTNDAPTLAAVTDITHTDTAADDTFAATSGTLMGADVDATNVLTYGINGGAASSDQPDYNIAKVGTYGTLYLNSATGAYLFQPSDGAIEALRATDSETFTVSVSDGIATTTQTLSVTLNGANDTPEISVIPNGTSLEDTPIIALSAAQVQNVIATYGSDRDSSDSMTVTWTLTYPDGSGLVPQVFTLDPVNGTTIPAPTNFSGDVTVTVRATDAGGLFAERTFTQTINPSSDAPTLSVAPTTGNEDTAIALGSQITAALTDPSETLTITITGIPDGATLANTVDGTLTVTAGAITLTLAQLAGLSITPPANSYVDFDLSVTATSQDGMAVCLQHRTAIAAREGQFRCGCGWLRRQWRPEPDRADTNG